MPLTAMCADSVGGTDVGIAVLVESAMSLGGSGTTAECSASTIALNTRQLWMARTTVAIASSTNNPPATLRRRFCKNQNREVVVVGTGCSGTAGFIYVCRSAWCVVRTVWHCNAVPAIRKDTLQLYRCHMPATCERD
jgi:hypothetical protein